MKLLLAILGFTVTSQAYAISCLTIEDNYGAKYASTTSKTLNDCIKSHNEIVASYSGHGVDKIKTTYKDGSTVAVLKTSIR